MERYKKGRVLKEKLHNWILKMLVIIEKVILLFLSFYYYRSKEIMVKKIFMTNIQKVALKKHFLK